MTEPAAGVVTADELAALVARHGELRRFVERRVASRALAEEILQDALVKSLDRVGEIRGSALGWFYRVLRNAIIDHARRAGARDRALAAYAGEQEAVGDEPGQAGAVCRCVGPLAASLKPAYADALQRVDVEGAAVKDYAAHAGITAANAGVRVFRARAALRKRVVRACGRCAERGCRDCTCGSR